MPTTFAIAVLAAGGASALAYASMLTGSPAAFVLAYIAQLPLFAVGLWMGTGAAAFAGVAGIVVAFLAGGFVFATIYTLSSAAPAAVLVRQALLWRPGAVGSVEWYPPGGLLLTLVAVATAIFLGIAFAFLGREGGLEGALETFIVDAFSRIRTPAGLQIDGIEAFAGQIARVFAGVVGVSWMVMTLVNAALAQGLLKRFAVNRRPSPAMADLDLPAWLTGLTAILAVGTFLDGFGGYVARNAMVILVAAYALAGLGVVHALAATLQWRGMALGAVYGALIVFGWPLAILAVVGLIEPYANIKARARTGASPNA
jgi:hypothetical protein